MSSKGDPSIGPTVIVGLVGTAATIVLVTLLHSYYGHSVKGEVERKVLAQPAVAVDQVRAEQLRQISEYRWIDPNTKVVAIPIDRAMELVVEESRANRTAAPAANATGGSGATASQPAGAAHPASTSHPTSPSAPRSR
jgi:hypothetical protein